MTGASITYLFSDEGVASLQAFVDRDTLFAFDLDGTLAPIAADPEHIRIPVGIGETLGELAGRAEIAIITGRSRQDARRHLGIAPRFLIGNHGAEGLPGAENDEADFRAWTAAWERQMRDLLSGEEDPGIVLENKGLSLSVHYRGAVDRPAARARVRNAVGQLKPPPRVVGGKYVENLLPECAPDKGTALLTLMKRSGRSKGLFVGDDRTDEDVFDLDSPHIFTVRVGRACRSRARFFLRGQREILRFLKHLNAVLARMDP
jgi:trehalose 6-phosphate phosphatase